MEIEQSSKHEFYGQLEGFWLEGIHIFAQSKEIIDGKPQSTLRWDLEHLNHLQVVNGEECDENKDEVLVVEWRDKWT